MIFRFVALPNAIDCVSNEFRERLKQGETETWRFSVSLPVRAMAGLGNALQ